MGDLLLQYCYKKNKFEKSFKIRIANLMFNSWWKGENMNKENYKWETDLRKANRFDSTSEDIYYSFNYAKKKLAQVIGKRRNNTDKHATVET